MPFDMQRVIAAHQAGLAERHAEEDRAQAAEDRKIQQQILKHQIDRLKIEDAVTARKAALENASFAQGSPAPQVGSPDAVATPASQVQTTPIPSGPALDAAASGAAAGAGSGLAGLLNGRKLATVSGAIPQGFTQPLPAQYVPGIPGIGDVQAVPGVRVQPQSQEQLNAASMAQKLQELRLAAFAKTQEPYTLNPGDKRFVGSNVIAEGGPKEPTGDFGQYFLPNFAAKLNKTVDTLTPQEGMQALQEFKTLSQDPDAKAQLSAIRDLQIQTQQIALGQQPTADDIKTTAENLVNHRIAPSQIPAGMGAGGQAFRRSVQMKALALDPNFSMEDAEASYQLVKSPTFQNTVRYMDSVQESIPLVIARANTLANGKVKSVNGLINAGKAQFNDVDLKKFNTDRILVADEIAKILQGGGSGSGTSDAKLAQAGQILQDTDSPAAIAAALSDVNELIGYRKKALTRGTYLEDKRAGPTAPKVGAVQDGYVFLGGDPSQPASWRKQ